MRALELKVPPPVVALAIGWIMWILPGAAAASEGWRVALAIALAVFAASLDVAALVAFRLARTTINPLKPAASSSLVRNGVYRFTRNPMYVGLAAMLLAWAVYLGNAAAVLGVPAFVLYIDRFQIRPEERILAGIFGEEYAAYCRAVRRWI